MADISVTITTDIEAAIRGAIPQPERRLGQAAAFVERETKLNFLREVDPEGKRWKPLKTATLRRKKTRATLRETSTLVNGIVGRKTAPDEAVIESTAGSEYGIWHQTGTRRIAQRRFIGWNERLQEGVTRILTE